MLSQIHHEIVGAGQPSLKPYCVFIDEDFVKGPAASATDDAATFDLVGTSAALTLEDDELFGVGKLVSNTTNQAQLTQNGEPIKLAAGRKVWFEARVKLADADGMSFFCGLAITDADVHDTNLTDYVGFFTTDGTLKVGCAKNSDNVPGSGTTGETDESTGTTLADDTFVVLRFEVDGLTAVKFYVNGVLTNTITSTICDDEQLTTIIAAKGSAETVEIDYVYGVVTR